MSIICIDTETTSKNPLKATPVSIQVTCDAGTLLIKPDDIEALAWLEKVWDDPTIEKIFQNGEYDILVLERLFGKYIQGYAWDTMLAEHLLHEESHYNLELLRGVYTNQPVYERTLREWKEEVVEELVGYTKKGKPKYKRYKKGDNLDGYSSVPEDILFPYGVFDSQTTFLVAQEQQKKYTPERYNLLKNVVLPMQLALKDMEHDGMLIDVERVPQIRQEYIDKLASLEKDIFKEADEEFKISSPIEVKRVLFEELGLPKPPIKSKKTGVVSAGKKSLDWLTTHADHPVLHKLEEWRATAQLLKAFLGTPDKNGNITTGLMSNLTEDNRLHTTFRMTLETGRNSSSPNLQNLPTAEKGPIRELFIAAPGNVLLQADYSQIELRVAAYESGDLRLIELLENNGDIHTIFARKLYPVDPTLSDNAWRKKYDHYRTLAKRFTFGRLFGQSEQGMAITFNISTDEALRFQAVYSELFPGMAAWWDKTILQVRSGRPLVTKFGRQRNFPAFTAFSAIQWRGKNGLFGHLDREALNFIPQATAADILSGATGRLGELIRRYPLPMRLRLVVHDSLTIECPASYTEKAARILKVEMEGVAREQFGWLTPVEIKYGRTWLGEMGTV